MMQQAELPLNDITILHDGHGSIVIVDVDCGMYTMQATTLDDVRRNLRRRRLDPAHHDLLLAAVAQAGVVEPDPTPAPF